MRILERLDRTRFLFVCTLLLLVPLVIDARILSGVGPETKFRFFEFGVLILILLSLPFFVRRKDPLSFSIFSLSLILFAAYFLFRAWIDSHFHYALDHALQTLCWVMFALVVRECCSNRRTFQQWVGLAVILQIALLVYAIGYIYGVDIFWKWYMKRDIMYGHDLVNEERGVIWALGNPNAYASFACMLLIWIMTLLAVCQRWWVRGLLLIYGGVVVYTLLYTGTRGIWVSLLPTGTGIVGVMILLSLRDRGGVRIFWRQNRKKIFALGFLVMVLLAGVFAYEQHKGGGVLHTVGKRFYHLAAFQDISLRARPLLWASSLRMWWEAPWLGQGHGRFASNFIETLYAIARDHGEERVQQLTRHMNTILAKRTHNDYLQYLSETGAMGYALFLLICLAGIIAALRALFQKQWQQKDVFLLLGCLAIVVYTLFHALFDFPLRLPASAMFFGFALGGIFFYSGEPTFFQLPAWTRWVITVIAIPLVIGLGSIIVQHYVATHLYSKGLGFLQLGTEDYEKDPSQAFRSFRLAEERFSSARKFFPGDGQILFSLGQTYYFLSKFMTGGQATDYRYRSIDYIERAMQTYSTPNVFHTLSKVYLDARQFSAAGRSTEKLLMIDPERDEAQFLAGMIDYMSGRFERAEQHFKEELRTNPKQARSLFYLGKILEEHYQQYEMAAAKYQESIDAAPNVMRTYERLGDLYAERLEQPLKALEQYRQALIVASQLNETLESRIRRKIQKIQDSLERMEQNE